MYDNQFFQPYDAGEQRSLASLNEMQLLTTSNTAPANPPQPQGRVGLDSTVLFLTPLCFMVIWATVAVICSNAWKITRSEITTTRSCPKVPCRNCRFFSNNPYLRCAIHPSAVLTEGAVDCSDYRPQKEEPASKKSR